MAATNIFYQPIYGVERANEKGEVVAGINPNGIGADESAQNLLITLWSLTDFPADFSAPVYDSIQIPSYLNTMPLDAPNSWATGDENHAPGFEEGMSARVACSYFYLDSNAKSPGVLMNVLDPPQEYRQQMAGAVEYAGGDPTNLSNYTLKKSLVGNMAWEQVDVSMAGVGLYGQTAVDIADTVFFSSYLDIKMDTLGITTGIKVPFLKTNGADGKAPEFFDRTTQSGIQEMIAAVNKGDFYIAYLVEGLITDGNINRLTIRWPYSASRG
jgi:hypothetical protein